MQGKWGLRGVALLAVGAMSLHELRSFLAGGELGSGSGHAHSYLPLAAGLVTVLLLLACLGFARSLVRALRGVDAEEGVPSVRVLWPLLAASLLGVYSLQEWIESWVTPGHPIGVEHVAGHIGWSGLALSLAIAAAIALLLRGARSAVAAIARRRAGGRARRAPLRTPPLRPVFLPRFDVLAGHLAGRAPPLAS
jgi:hypothetical protein